MTYTVEIRLIEKGRITRSPVTVKGDTSGDLTPYRISATYRDTINDTIPNGQMTLRAPFGLFDTVEPILTDSRAKHKYLITVKLTQGTNSTDEFRYEIASSTVQDSNKGKHITIQLMHPAIRLKETYDSTRLTFKTPYEAFNLRMDKFIENTWRALTIQWDPGLNGLPNVRSLRQGWYPTEPVTTLELLSEIIRRTSQPQTVSSTNEDYYFNITPVPNFPVNYNMHVSKFGSVSSGVQVSVKPTGAGSAGYDISKDTDNKRFKNSLILKGARGAHAYPIEYTRYVSDSSHSRPEYAEKWVSRQNYLKGDYVVDDDSNGYKARQDHLSSNARSPQTNRIYWEPIIERVDYSPFTTDADLWLNNMDGQGNKLGYAGYFHDLNIVRRLYDIDKLNNDFATMAVKDVIEQLNRPPANPKHGQRWLLTSNPTGAWSGKGNRIAQWHIDHWEFSDPPEVDKVMINVNNLAWVRIWNGSDFETAWSLNDENAIPSAPSPYCPVKSLTQDKGRYGTAGKAIQMVFDWNYITTKDQLVTVVNSMDGLLRYTPVGIYYYFLNRAFSTEATDRIVSGKSTTYQEARARGDTDEEIVGAVSNSKTLTDGSKRNREGRRYCWSISFPFGPKIVDRSVDFYNMDHSMDRKATNWNQGPVSENLGNIRGLTFWCKLRMEDAKDRLITGQANIKQIFWFQDISDRIAIYRYDIPTHGEWQKITIPAGPGSNLELHDSRIDELSSLFGWVFSDQTFLKERELTGVRFDWTNVVSMGSFNAASYDENLMYIGARDAWFKTLTEHLSQFANDSIHVNGVIDRENLIVDHVRYWLEDINFQKDAYVLTSDGPVTDLRQELIRYTEDTDYVNMREIVGKRMVSRKQFHPLKEVIYCDGNVRLRAGQSFNLQASHDTGTEIVAAAVEHIEDQSGYHCMIHGVRRYETDQ